MTRALMSLALACLAGLPLVAAPKLRDKTRPLAEDIVGEWRVTQRSTENGPMEDGMTSWKIAEGKLTSNLGGADNTWKMTLDAKASPATIDLSQNGSTLLGIVEIVGDIMRVCYRSDPGERPTTFVPKDGALLVELTRPGKK